MSGSSKGPILQVPSLPRECEEDFLDQQASPSSPRAADDGKEYPFPPCPPAMIQPEPVCPLGLESLEQDRTRNREGLPPPQVKARVMNLLPARVALKMRLFKVQVNTSNKFGLGWIAMVARSLGTPGP